MSSNGTASNRTNRMELLRQLGELQDRVNAYEREKQELIARVVEAESRAHVMTTTEQYRIHVLHLEDELRVRRRETEVLQAENAKLRAELEELKTRGLADRPDQG